MSTAEGKTRITITLGDGVLAMLDEDCARSGVSRSAAISRALVEAYDSPVNVTPEQMIEFLQGVIRQRDKGL